MRIKTAIAAIAISLAGLGANGLIGVDTAIAAPAMAARHACTHTSTGHCIAGGQFCPQASYGHSGWDAKGRRYVCKGDHTHPHWMIP